MNWRLQGRAHPHPAGGQSPVEDSVAELQSGPRGRTAQCCCLPFHTKGEESRERFLRGQCFYRQLILSFKLLPQTYLNKPLPFG